MGKSRVLITGGSGLLAANWACAVRDKWDVVLGTHVRSVSLQGTHSRPVPIDEPEQFGRAIRDISPDLVVHTAALANVDRCEQDPARARRENAGLARTVARECFVTRIPLIHISTDQLFAGDRSFYSETDPTNPLNEYARSKLLGEEWVRDAYKEALIVRTNFFGWGPAGRQSLSTWIIKSLRAGNPLTLFDDVHFTPILADSLARAAHDLVAKSVSGIFNVVGDERLSKHAFGELLANRFQLPASAIRRGRIADAGLVAVRQRDMSLSNEKTRQVLGRPLGNVEEYLSALQRQEADLRPEELVRSIPE